VTEEMEEIFSCVLNISGGENKEKYLEVIG
jgi:hypothetical protein